MGDEGLDTNVDRGPTGRDAVGHGPTGRCAVDHEPTGRCAAGHGGVDEGRCYLSWWCR